MEKIKVKVYVNQGNLQISLTYKDTTHAYEVSYDFSLHACFPHELLMMLGLIKHFYEHGKHTATTKFNEIETKFIHTG